MHSFLFVFICYYRFKGVERDDLEQLDGYLEELLQQDVCFSGMLSLPSISTNPVEKESLPSVSPEGPSWWMSSQLPITGQLSSRHYRGAALDDSWAVPWVADAPSHILGLNSSPFSLMSPPSWPTQEKTYYLPLHWVSRPDVLHSAIPVFLVHSR